MGFRWALLGLVASIYLSSQASQGCYISGSDTGVCDSRIEEEPEYKGFEMPFCGPVITYTPCVPEQKPLAPDRKFNREGRWINHTTLTKDKVKKALFERR
jgi:hypothetical protein